MNTINQTNGVNDNYIGEATTASRSNAGTGVIAMLDDLIAMLQKMNMQIRDIDRNHYTNQQQVAHKKDMLAIATKEKAIELNYISARSNAIGKIVSGALSVHGAVSGGFATATLGESVGGSVSTWVGGIGKIAEGGMAYYGASKSREAQELQLIADYQTTLATENRKNLDAIADKAAEASRMALEVERDLMNMKDRITSAGKL